MTPRTEFRRRLLAAVAGDARLVAGRKHTRLVISRGDGREILLLAFVNPKRQPALVKNAIADIRRLLKEGEK